MEVVDNIFYGCFDNEIRVFKWMGVTLMQIQEGQLCEKSHK